jgi:hypothetical protein
MTLSLYGEAITCLDLQIQYVQLYIVEYTGWERVLLAHIHLVTPPIFPASISQLTKRASYWGSF